MGKGMGSGGNARTSEEVLNLKTLNASGIQKDGKLVTRIHGKFYDLTEFASRHPGGPNALELVRDRDGTALFESYHPLTRDKAWATLQKFEVDKDSFDGSTRFLYVKKFGEDRFKWGPDSSPFRRELTEYAKVSLPASTLLTPPPPPPPPPPHIKNNGTERGRGK